MLRVVLLFLLCCTFNVSAFDAVGKGPIKHSSYPDLKFRLAEPWKEYLVEFRGMLPNFRLPELKDAFDFTFKCIDEQDCGHFATLFSNSLDDFLAVIPDVQSSVPICGYMKLPHEEIIQAALLRSGLVKRVVDVWADAVELQDVQCQALLQFDRKIAPHFPPDASAPGTTWRVEFSRYGRSGSSGMDEQGKRALLGQFGGLLRRLGGSVSLRQPQHTLVYYEDWHDYQFLHNIYVNHARNSSAPSEGEGWGAARRHMLGRVVARGPNVAVAYDLRSRPFLGTTTMKPICSHVAAMAAMAGQGAVVLDPFCGSSSLLVACAALGGRVLGSDVDPTSVGAEQGDKAEGGQRAKNKGFMRKSGETQAGLSSVDNFHYYGLEAQVEGLFQRDALQWLQETELSLQGIVTDPPFGRRERLALPPDLLLFNDEEQREMEKVLSQLAPSEAELKDPTPAVALLLLLGERRVRNGGRVVFWLASVPSISPSLIEQYLLTVHDKVKEKEGRGQLRLLRVTREELGAAMWRWLCVWEKDGQEKGEEEGSS